MASFKNALLRSQLAGHLVPHSFSMAAVLGTPISYTPMHSLAGRNLARSPYALPSPERASNLMAANTFKTASITIEERLWNYSMRVRGFSYVEVAK